MLVKRLEEKRPEFDPALWLDYWALYEGGDRFYKRIKRFLFQNPQEPAQVYAMRCREAVYRNYTGTIIDYFASLLLVEPPTLTTRLANGTAETEPPEWLSEVLDNCDAAGTDLLELLREALVHAMVKRCSFIALEFPENYGTGQNLADADRTGGTDVRLSCICREDVYDCEYDKAGRLVWAIVRTSEKPRPTPEDSRSNTLIRWRVYTREVVDTYEATLKDGEALDEEKSIEPVSSVRHNLGEVPLIELDVSEGLWVGNRISSPQLEHFRLTAANNWSMRRTCYAMPVFMVDDPDKFAKRTLGTGYYIAIGEKEKFEWAAPPTGHIDSIAKEVASQKDEIFRIVSQMALGVDNNAAAVGRSADSKLADAEAMVVVLRAFGGKLRDALKKTLNLLSRARADGSQWSIEGFQRFETIPATTLAATLVALISLRIQSETFYREAHKRVTLGLLPGATEQIRKKIGDEIDAGKLHDPAEEALQLALSQRQGTPRGGGAAGGGGGGNRPGATPPGGGARDAGGGSRDSRASA